MQRNTKCRSLTEGGSSVQTTCLQYIILKKNIDDTDSTDSDMKLADELTLWYLLIHWNEIDIGCDTTLTLIPEAEEQWLGYREYYSWRVRKSHYVWRDILGITCMLQIPGCSISVMTQKLMTWYDRLIDYHCTMTGAEEIFLLFSEIFYCLCDDTVFVIPWCHWLTMSHHWLFIEAWRTATVKLMRPAMFIYWCILYSIWLYFFNELMAIPTSLSAICVMSRCGHQHWSIVKRNAVPCDWLKLQCMQMAISVSFWPASFIHAALLHGRQMAERLRNINVYISYQKIFLLLTDVTGYSDWLRHHCAIPLKEEKRWWREVLLC